jgi:hypothetical protein
LKPIRNLNVLVSSNYIRGCNYEEEIGHPQTRRSYTMDRQTVKTLKWVSGGIEAVLGIPILGGSIVLGFGWTPLLLMLVFHIVVLVLSKKVGVKATGNIIGIVTSVIGWIPFVGMIMHIVSAIFILRDAARKDKNPDIIEMS